MGNPLDKPTQKALLAQNIAKQRTLENFPDSAEDVIKSVNEEVDNLTAPTYKSINANKNYLSLAMQQASIEGEPKTPQINSFFTNFEDWDKARGSASAMTKAWDNTIARSKEEDELALKRKVSMAKINAQLAKLDMQENEFTNKVNQTKDSIISQSLYNLGLI